MSGLTDQIRREVGRQAANARNAFRAVLRSIGLATKVQRIGGEGLSGETLEQIEHFQQFGFTSAPPADAELIVLPLGGRTSASVIVATEHGATRFVLDNQGETCVYNQWGDFAHFKKDRSIHVKAEEKVFVETKVFRVEASQRVEIVTPEMLVQASTRVRMETPDVQATTLLRSQQMTIGGVPGGVGAPVATMSGGTVNYSNVTFNFLTGNTVNHANTTEARTGGSITHNGRKIDGNHVHPETGGTTDVPNP